MAMLEQDTFIRPAVPPGSWGTATNGDPWSIIQGTTSCFSTNGTQGVMANTSGRSHTRIGSTSNTNQVVSCDVTPSVASNDEFGINARQSGTVGTGISLYRLTISPVAGGLILVKAVTGTATQLGSTVTKSVSNLTKYTFKLSCVGTSIQGKMWLAGTSEPSTWDISVADSAVASGAPGCTGNSFDTVGIKYQNFVAFDPNSTSQMLYDELQVQYARLRSSSTNSHITRLALVYYSPTQILNEHVVPGELDVLLSGETTFHILKSTKDVSDFITAHP